jgi:hypothetical protein
MCDGMNMGPPVRSGCSRTPRLSSGYFVECCVALDNVGDPTCPADEMTAMALSQSSGCPPPPPPAPPPAPPAPPPPFRPIRGCMDETAYNYNRLAREDDGTCQYGAPPPQAIVGCMDREATNYNPAATYPAASCIYPPPMPPPPPPPPPAPVVTGGTGSLAGSGTVGSGCCSSQTCECEGVDSCTVVTDAAFEWVDIMTTGTQITAWENNNGDDGWFHVDLPFPFHWFGVVELRITIGTNGVLTFGDDQLPYGDSEPVPCQWNGGGQGAGQDGCVQAGDEVTTGGHYGVQIDGIIAAFWCDLNPDAAGGDGEGVYYSIARSDDERLIAFNKLIVE